MAYNVYHNPTDVAVGSQSLTGVVAIAVQVNYAEIHAAADTDTHEGVARYTTGSTTGTITFIDPVQAEIAKDLSGTLTATLTDTKGASDATLTVAGCSCGGFDASAGRDSASNATVPFTSTTAAAIA